MPKTKVYKNTHTGTRFTRNPNVRIMPNSLLALMASKPLDCVWVVVDPLETLGFAEPEDAGNCVILPTRRNGTLRAPNDKNKIKLPNSVFESLVENGTFKIV